VRPDGGALATGKDNTDHVNDLCGRYDKPAAIQQQICKGAPLPSPHITLPFTHSSKMVLSPAELWWPSRQRAAPVVVSATHSSRARRGGAPGAPEDLVVNARDCPLSDQLA
jgi:hypothetical protein